MFDLTSIVLNMSVHLCPRLLELRDLAFPKQRSFTGLHVRSRGLQSSTGIVNARFIASQSTPVLPKDDPHLASSAVSETDNENKRAKTSPGDGPSPSRRRYHQRLHQRSSHARRPTPVYGQRSWEPPRLTPLGRRTPRREGLGRRRHDLKLTASRHALK